MNENAIKQSTKRKSALRIGVLCVFVLIALPIYASVLGTNLGALIALLLVEGIVALLAWVFLRKVLRVASFWALTLISAGLGLAVGWYGSFRMSGNGLLREIWLSSEKFLGRSLTEAESSDLYTRTLASSDFWISVHQRAVVPALGVFLIILISLLLLKPRRAPKQS